METFLQFLLLLVHVKFLAHLWRMETQILQLTIRAVEEVFSSLMKDGNQIRDVANSRRRVGF